MVSRGASAILGEAPFVDLIEAMYQAIEGLSPTGYRSADSDAWTRARGPQPTTHLSFYVFAGDDVTVGATFVLGSRVIVACRYVPEQHPAHLARAHAAAYAVAARLRQGFTGAGRVLVKGWSVDYALAEAGWLLVDVAADVHLPW